MLLAFSFPHTIFSRTIAMSWGFSAGDFILAIKICKSVGEAIRNGPKEYQELQEELVTVQHVMRALTEDAKDPMSLLNRKGVARRGELLILVKSIEGTVREVQQLVDKHSSLQEAGAGRYKRIWHLYRIGRADLDSLRGRLTFHVSHIEVFLTGLHGSALSRIESKLDQVYNRMLEADRASSHTRQDSVASATSMLSIETNEENVWDRIKTQLLASDIPLTHILRYRREIIDHIKSLNRSTLSTPRNLSQETLQMNSMPNLGNQNTRDDDAGAGFQIGMRDGSPSRQIQAKTLFQESFNLEANDRTVQDSSSAEQDSHPISPFTKLGNAQSCLNFESEETPGNPVPTIAKKPGTYSKRPAMVVIFAIECDSLSSAIANQQPCKLLLEVHHARSTLTNAGRPEFVFRNKGLSTHFEHKGLDRSIIFEWNPTVKDPVLVRDTSSLRVPLFKWRRFPTRFTMGVLIYHEERDVKISVHQLSREPEISRASRLGHCYVQAESSDRVISRSDFEQTFEDALTA